MVKGKILKLLRKISRGEEGKITEIFGKKIKNKTNGGWGRISSVRELHIPLEKR